MGKSIYSFIIFYMSSLLYLVRVQVKVPLVASRRVGVEVTKQSM